MTPPFHLTDPVALMPGPGVVGDPLTGGPVPGSFIRTPIVIVPPSATIRGVVDPLGGLIPGALGLGPRGAIVAVPGDPLGIGRVRPLHTVLRAAVLAAPALPGVGANNAASRGTELVLVCKRLPPALPRPLLRLPYRLCLPPLLFP